MREEARGTSMRGGAWMRYALVVMKVLFWSSATLVALLAILSWVVPALTSLRFFDVLDGAVLGLTMVSSGLLFWQELRANRHDDEWTPMGWLYATAFGLSAFLSLYMLPALYFAP
jgi:hypothetical protein